MTKKMNKRAFINYLAKTHNKSVEQVVEAYNMIIGGIIDVVKQGYVLSLMRFGVFRIQIHKGHPIQFNDKSSSVCKYKVFKFSAADVLNSDIRNCDIEIENDD